MERSHSLIPSPPASATVMNDMNGPNGFQWNQQGMTNGQSTNGISIDTNLTNNGRSMPNTPATTPPGAAIQPMSYPQVSQSYDNSRQMYQTSAPQASAYPPPHTAAQERPMYTHSSYVKSEMAPPSNRAGIPNGEPVDAKPTNGIMHAGQGEPTNGVEDEADQEHDGEYTHDSGAYDSTRGPYNYSAPPVSALQNDHSHLSPELTGSPHQGSGRATPRTAAAPQSYYPGQTYNTTPPRVGQTSSNLYSVMSHERGSTNGTTTNDVYGSQGDLGPPLQNGYTSSGQLNGVPSNGVPSMKRGRDDDDDRSDMKRRKGVSDGTMPSPTYNNQMPQPPPPVAPQRRR
jgi:protein SOK2